MTSFNDLLDLALTGVSLAPSLGRDPDLAEALRRIGATPEEALDFEPGATYLDDVATWQARNPDLPF